MQLLPPKVAVCFAGAWRDWDTVRASIHAHMIESLDADVFAISDSDSVWTVDHMRKEFGRRFKGGFQIPHRPNISSIAWPEIAM